MSLSKSILVALSLGFYGYAEEERITNDGSNKRDPIFIAQGKTLVYCLDEKDDLIRAVSMDLSDPSPNRFRFSMTTEVTKPRLPTPQTSGLSLSVNASATLLEN